MKKMTILFLAVLSLNLFAGPIEDKVSEVENEYQAHCVQSSRSTFSKCFGMPQTCFYHVKYKCFSDQENFSLKVKVRENTFGTVVRGIVINQ
jgi:hypothetical protein